MPFPSIAIQLPAWLRDMAASCTEPLPNPEDRMHLVIDFARKNIEQGNGGPFGAAVFDMDTHRLVAPGVNLVTSAGLSLAHAEIIALTMAQKLVGTFDLAGKGHFELVTSCEPCAMCFGAIPWSGIRSLLCGATSADAESIGFDEGPRHPHWVEELERRDINVQTHVCRNEAKRVLLDYAATNGVIYNGREKENPTT